MKIIFKLKNELGEFVSDEMNVNEEQYRTILEMSKTFYMSGYEMPLVNGFLVAPPEILKKSILIIEIIE
jgi:hypothetical protein